MIYHYTGLKIWVTSSCRLYWILDNLNKVHVMIIIMRAIYWYIVHSYIYIYIYMKCNKSLISMFKHGLSSFVAAKLQIIKVNWLWTNDTIWIHIGHWLRLFALLPGNIRPLPEPLVQCWLINSVLWYSSEAEGNFTRNSQDICFDIRAEYYNSQWVKDLRSTKWCIYGQWLPQNILMG